MVSKSNQQSILDRNLGPAYVFPVCKGWGVADHFCSSCVSCYLSRHYALVSKCNHSYTPMTDINTDNSTRIPQHTNYHIIPSSSSSITMTPHHTTLMSDHSGALGSAGDGAPTDLPFLFSRQHTDTVPLAIARAGGLGGPVFVYSEQQGCTSWAGGGRQWF